MLLAALVPHPPLILPSVGRGSEAGVAATAAAYRRLAAEITAAAPETIVVISPHAEGYADAWRLSDGDGTGRLRGDMAAFRAPETCLSWPIDRPLNDAIVRATAQDPLPAVADHRRHDSFDHGTFIPLYFLHETGLRDAGLVRIAYTRAGTEAARAFGAALAAAINTSGRRIVLIASGDLSHRLLADGPYGYDPAGPLFDQKVQDAVTANRPQDFLAIGHRLAERAGHCGLTALEILAGYLLAAGPWQGESELYSYEGPYGVGYAVAAFRQED
ncbi:MAG: class III extradiol dioxygenase subunit B-like domain-containing protein [Bacillota bacterium]|nr:class III extradiol dioxygenase subunit B-like domain-containing protein [Bacillota bacterium]